MVIVPYRAAAPILLDTQIGQLDIQMGQLDIQIGQLDTPISQLKGQMVR